MLFRNYKFQAYTAVLDIFIFQTKDWKSKYYIKDVECKLTK